jgi:hypothetical protein
MRGCAGERSSSGQWHVDCYGKFMIEEVLYLLRVTKNMHEAPGQASGSPS